MHLAGESIISLVDCHGEEEGGLFLFVEIDDRQLQHHPQTFVSTADSQDSSNGGHYGVIFFKPEKNLEFFRLKMTP